MFIGNIKHDAILNYLNETELCFFSATFTDLPSCWFIDFHSQNDSSKLNSVFKILQFQSW